MQILPNHYYCMTMRYGDWERNGRCIHLRLEELTPDERKHYKGVAEGEDIPTHRIIFFDLECYRTLEGKLKENTAEKLILAMGKGKEYEFSPFKPSGSYTPGVN